MFKEYRRGIQSFAASSPVPDVAVRLDRLRVGGTFSVRVSADRVAAPARAGGIGNAPGRFVSRVLPDRRWAQYGDALLRGGHMDGRPAGGLLRQTDPSGTSRIARPLL